MAILEDYSSRYYFEVLLIRGFFAGQKEQRSLKFIQLKKFTSNFCYMTASKTRF